MINRITTLRNTSVNEITRSVTLTLERDDEAEMSCEFSAEILAELVGLANMASDALSANDDDGSLSNNDLPILVGIAAKASISTSSVRLELEDKQGFISHFDVSEEKALELLRQLRRGSALLVNSSASDTPNEQPDITLAVNNPEKQ